MFARSIHRDKAAPAARPAQLASLICQAPGCTRCVPQNRLMCYLHWTELPCVLRIAVASSWTSWLAGEITMRPYMIARLAAIVYIGKLHGIDVTAQEAKLEKAREALVAETTHNAELHLKEETTHER